MTNTHKHLLQLTKQSKTLKQVHQIHAHSITSSHTQLILPQILHKLTTITNTSPQSHHNYSLYAYLTRVFSHITNPTPHSLNTLIRTLKPKSQAPQSFHALALKLGFTADCYITNSLIHFYSLNNFPTLAHKLFYQTPVKDVVTYNVMLDGLVKNQNIPSAKALFNAIPFGIRDSVTWGTMISGFVNAGMFNNAIELFETMVTVRLRPDNVAIVSVLSACASLGDLTHGKGVHEFIKQNKIRVDAYLCTALVDFYSKCGCINTAIEVFENGDSEKNLFTWNAMIVGLAMHYGDMAIRYFSRMVDNGVRPDGVTLLGVLVACSHAGLVDEAKTVFKCMECVYGVRREVKHYGCMADLLARAGMVKEAVEMIEGMHVGGDVYVWGGLLGGCRIHGNVEIAEQAAMRVMELDPEDSGVYSIMTNIYADMDRWEDVNKVRELTDTRKVRKNAGWSAIQVDEFTHEFVAGDTLHPRTDEIYVVLEAIGKAM